MKRIYNFNPGPATLPLSVLEEASRGVLEIADSGMSVLETSHRGKEYEAIHFDAMRSILEVMGLSPEEYSVMFLGEGASLQFAMVPMNFLAEGASADYVNTGEWAERAIKEARLFGQVNVVASSEKEKFTYIPKDLKFNPDARYVHITTNNTIEGTQWWTIPDLGDIPLVADMSSDFLSRKMDFSRFSLIYAGAQKNAGPAGVTIIVARKSFIEKARKGIPAILSYKTHMEKDSLYNTPPCFCVYVVDLVMKWIKARGGLRAIEETNRKKAELLYEAIDEMSDFYRGTVTAKEDRSWMNVTFRLPSEELEDRFVSAAKKEHGLHGLKGHRSVGGCRASLYNALPIEAVGNLVEYMREFARQHRGNLAGAKA